MKNIFTVLISSAIVSLVGCTTTEKFSYNTWDTNNDDALSTEEFTNVFKMHYASDWKEQQEMGTIQFTNQEFFQSSFAFWDADDNDYIDQDEWEAVNEFYFNKYGFEDFENIDDNNNGQLSYNEYIDEIEDNGLFNGWDKNEDDVVSEAELAQGVFNSYDFDNSGYLEQGEFNTFTSFYAEL